MSDSRTEPAGVESGRTDAAEGRSIDIRALAADPPLLEACLDVYRRLELRDQLQALLGRSCDWMAARAGIAFGPAEESDLFAPLARLAAAGAEPPEVSTVDGGRLRRWTAGGMALHAGAGPFEEIVTLWPGGAPTTVLALPVRGGGRPLAVVLLLALDAAPAAADLERLTRLVDAVQPALVNGLQLLAIRELVIKDDTAECFNRRYFETTLPAELSRASRFRSALSLIFLDMDNLKEVNKRHGHVMGSRTLLEVSHRVRARIRRFDKLFRFGGDEFCIVLPETEWHGALEVAERVRDAIAGRPFLTKELGDANGVRMTASLGIASFPLHARTQKELIEHADRAMQRIKNGTKNSIGIAEIVGDGDGG
jgi:diguanylate cyclase (GGDEF)-like protein